MLALTFVCKSVLIQVGASSAKFRAQVAELCFQKYNAPSVSFVKDAPLQCYSLGRTRGFVVDCAAHGTRTCAVVEGWAEEKVNMETTRTRVDISLDSFKIDSR